MPNTKANQHILIEDARQNNLKGVSLRIPLDRITLVTGVSGSGKSSLAFDTYYSDSIFNIDISSGSAILLAWLE